MRLGQSRSMELVWALLYSKGTQIPLWVREKLDTRTHHCMRRLSGRGFKHVSFESDCHQLLQIIHSSKSWSALEPELDDIELLRTSFFFSWYMLYFKISKHPCGYSCKRDLNFWLVDLKVPQQLALEVSMLGPI